MEDNFIANFPKPETSDKKVHWNNKNPKTCAYRSKKIDKISENSTDQNYSHKIYRSMAHMYSNSENPRRYFGDSSQLTNWVLGSGATFHMKPDISDFIPGSFVETDKYIEVSYGHSVTAKQTR